MRVSIIKEDGMVIVNGVGRQVDLTDMPACHAVHWDAARGIGKVEYAFDDLVDTQVRDVDAECQACAEARAAGTPEPTEMLYKTVRVRRPATVFAAFEQFQVYIDRWQAAAPVPQPADPRIVEIDTSISTETIGATIPKTVAELKAMTLAQFSSWFDANFDTQAKLIGLLKRLTLIIVRRVL